MMHRALSAALAATLCVSCARAAAPSSAAATRIAPERGLKDTFRGAFLVGTALAPRQFGERDLASVALIEREFNAISPENVLKWALVHPQPDQYDFGPSDQYVAFGEK